MKEKGINLHKVNKDFLTAFKTLKGVNPGIVCFSSAKINKGPFYDLATNVCKELSRKGYNIITGGGPGIMEACNRGAIEGKNGKSIGFQIELPNQSDNPYLDISIKFKYFFSRKTMFARYANAYVVFPGGFGTLDELFEILTLIQTQKIKKKPIILVGVKYWQNLIKFIINTLQHQGAINKRDYELITFTDDTNTIIKIIDSFIKEKQRFPRKKFI